MATNWVAVTAKPPNKRRFTRSLEKSLRTDVPKQSKLDFEKIIATWDDKPTILVKLEKKTNLYSVFVGVESNWSSGKTATPEDIFMFLSRGTKVRYATMTSNFTPKTAVGLIGSRSGSGGVIKVDSNNPRRGIKARKFEQTVAKKNKSPIAEKTQEGFNKAAVDSKWAL